MLQMSVQQMMAGVGEAGRNARVSTGSGVQAHCLPRFHQYIFSFCYVTVSVKLTHDCVCRAMAQWMCRST